MSGWPRECSTSYYRSQSCGRIKSEKNQFFSGIDQNKFSLPLEGDNKLHVVAFSLQGKAESRHRYYFFSSPEPKAPGELIV